MCAASFLIIVWCGTLLYDAHSKAACWRPESTHRHERNQRLVKRLGNWSSDFVGAGDDNLAVTAADWAETSGDSSKTMVGWDILREKKGSRQGDLLFPTGERRMNARCLPVETFVIFQESEKPSGATASTGLFSVRL